MSVGRDCFSEANYERDKKGAYEQVSRCHEEEARGADATKVDDSQEEEKHQTDPQCVRQQRRHGRNERANSGCNCDGDIQYVIETKSGGCKNSGEGAKIFLGDGV